MKFKEHLLATFLLAFPVMLSQLSHTLVGLTDTKMVGGLGSVSLAAASLGIAINSTLLVFVLGFSFVVAPMVAKANAEGNPSEIRKLFSNSFMVQVLGAAFGALLIIATLPLLNLTGLPQDVVEQSKLFSVFLALSLIPVMIYQSIKQIVEGLGYTRPGMYIGFLQVILTVIFNYLLIYGNYGFPKLGLAGCGIATLIARCFMALAFVVYVYLDKEFVGYFKGAFKGTISKIFIFKLAKTGLPVAFQLVFEVAAFAAASVIIGYLGAINQAAHQIAIQLASMTYMAASGLGVAASIRVGGFLGAKDSGSIRAAGFSAFWMVLGFMGVCAIALLVYRFSLPAWFVADPEVISIAAMLIAIAAFFQLSDGVNVVMLGALRGLQDVNVPTYIALFAYWVVGIPFGCILAFPLGMGASGIWVGLSAGLTISAILLTYRFLSLSKNMKVLSAKAGLVTSETAGH